MEKVFFCLNLCAGEEKGKLAPFLNTNFSLHILSRNILCTAYSLIDNILFFKDF